MLIVLTQENSDGFIISSNHVMAYADNINYSEAELQNHLAQRKFDVCGSIFTLGTWSATA